MSDSNDTHSQPTGVFLWPPKLIEAPNRSAGPINNSAMDQIVMSPVLFYNEFLRKD